MTESWIDEGVRVTEARMKREKDVLSESAHKKNGIYFISFLKPCTFIIHLCFHFINLQLFPFPLLLLSPSLSYHLVLRRPDNNESAWTSFTREFQWQVWLVVGFTLLVSSFVFYATGKSPFEGETISLGDAFLLVFGSLCAQSESAVGFGCGYVG